MKKCTWALSSPNEEQYHDLEWGVPVHDDRLLFEFLILEGAQAGLSWSTILNKREGYRLAFDNFDAETVAGYDDKKINELLANPAIVRNKLKINAAVINAQAYLKVQQDFGSFDGYIWQFVDGKPLHNAWKSHADIPASTPASELMSKDLKKRGFKFVGSTICYAYMQATGMVNDHTIDCYRHAEIKKLSYINRSC
ncbi:MAG TPA: DNA-3-methyladenine glycosylase I [Methylobacter sp.]|jgi:DNA-3-methyladenine glycosylase I